MSEKHLNEQFIDALKYMNKTMKEDNKAGHQWTYCNTASKKAKNFEQARKLGKYKINCVDGPQWALLLCGVANNALSWYGSDGSIAWLNSNAKKNAKKYFDIISTGGKTVGQLYSTGFLCDGDILLGYNGFAHTNVYIGGAQSFDTGHAFSTPRSGEGAKIKKFIGPLQCKSTKVNYILRIKDRAHYRVQAGAFETKEKLDERIALLQSKGYKTQVFEEDGFYKVQVGYFSGKTNAENLVAELQKKGIDAFVKEV